MTPAEIEQRIAQLLADRADLKRREKELPPEDRQPSEHTLGPFDERRAEIRTELRKLRRQLKAART